MVFLEAALVQNAFLALQQVKTAILLAMISGLMTVSNAQPKQPAKNMSKQQ
tara:strand:- start:102 stop:254 length:153 start_codon:yes stop_codon:yes gene_type:complete